MKHLLLFLFFLPCSSLLWGQTCVPDSYGNCSDSPFWSAHAFVDAMELFDTPVGTQSQYAQKFGCWPCYQPFTLTTWKGWTRPFELDAFEIDPRDNTTANGIFVISSYCGTPLIPPQPDMFCKMVVSWTPTHEGMAVARAYFKAHFLDDGSDATHTVLLIGYGLPPTR